MVSSGCLADPSRKPMRRAPLIGGSTCAFHRTELSLVSFSVTLGPRGVREVVVLDEAAVCDMATDAI
jgi:hypothetical protein